MVQPTESTYRSPASAKEAFSEFLRRCDEGGPRDLAAFCAEFPRHAEEIRRLHAEWADISRVFAGWVAGPSIEERVAREQGIDQLPDVRLEHAVANDEVPEVFPELFHSLKLHRAAFGRYRVQAEIGRGGMGRVSQVWDAELKRHLAMKQIFWKRRGSRKDDVGPEEIARVGRFLEEAQITAQLDHPGIVPVHELGLDARGRLYFTMLLVRGEDLSRVLEQHREDPRKMPRERIVLMLLRACEAVAFAHSKGVIHRDLKPSNIRVGRFGEVYVMDWGLARLVRGDGAEVATDDSEARVQSDRQTAVAPGSPLETRHGQIVGTPACMSPEQARGELVRMGPASDVYSMGTILYELLAGFAPYREPEADSRPEEILQRLRREPPLALGRRVPRQPPELVAICEMAMAREPADRYPDIGAMADDLRAFLENRVVSALRTGSVAELQKWVGRNRWLAGSLVVAVLALVGSLVGALGWQHERYGLLEAQNRLLTTVAVARRDPRSLGPTGQRLEQQQRLDELAEVLDALPDAVQNEAVQVEMLEILVRAAAVAQEENQMGLSADYLDRVDARLKEFPSTRPAAAWRVQAQALDLRAEVKRASGDLPAARALLEEALALLAPDGAGMQHVADPLLELTLLEHRANLSLLMEGHPASRAWYARLLEAARRSHAESPGDLETTSRYAVVLEKSARSWYQQRQYEDARRILDEALALREELALQRPDDRLLQFLHAGTLSQSADLDLAFGRATEAEDAFRRSLEILELLHREDPREFESARKLAGVLYWLGTTIQQQGRHDEAGEYTTRSFELRQRLAHDYPRSVAALDDWLTALFAMADYHRSRAEVPQAVPLLEEGVEVARRILSLQPESIHSQVGVGHALLQLGATVGFAGEPERALALLGEALESIEQVANRTASPEATDLLESVRNQTAFLLNQLGRPEEARRLFLQNRQALVDRLAAGDGIADEQLELANTMYFLAGTLVQLEELEAALDEYHEVLDLLDAMEVDPADVRPRQTRAATSRRLGDLYLDLGEEERAREAFEEAVRWFETLESSVPGAAADREAIQSVLEGLSR